MGSLRDDFMQGIREGVRQESDKLITALTEEVDQRGITNRGSLRQGFEKTVVSTGAKITVQITGVSYANYVAEGTSGYSAPPPIQPLRRWVETKLNVPQPLVPKVAYGTQKNIFEHGTPTPGSPLQGRNDYVQSRRTLTPSMLILAARGSVLLFTR